MVLALLAVMMAVGLQMSSVASQWEDPGLNSSWDLSDSPPCMHGFTRASTHSLKTCFPHRTECECLSVCVWSCDGLVTSMAYSASALW